jgi:hypothetical protein
MGGRAAVAVAVVLWASTLVVASEKASGAFFEGSGSKTGHMSAAGMVDTSEKAPEAFSGVLFEPGDTCMVCHNNLITRAGVDISIGADWRASMMANSARDPYWQAAVRRELMDHPGAAEVIEDECSICHMPMTTFPARAAGGAGRIFDHLPLGRPDDLDAALAADGVSCSVCHQIQPTRFGERSSFTGGYVIDVSTTSPRKVFGPYAIDAGRTRVMQSSSGFQPTESAHVQQSELCATCHTLFTHSLAPGTGEGQLPEQVPYLEWQQSSFRDRRSCQSCHMPVVDEEVALSQVLGQPRAGVSRHTFLGGNFFMMRMLNRYRADLGVRATPAEMEAAIGRTVTHLQSDTARVRIASAERVDGRIAADVVVENLAGHKFPTAYPSRRAWIQFTVRDARGQVLFESGGWTADGRITGNDNDADAGRFEPHYPQIDRPDQVQIYESVMGDPSGRITTGLLTGSLYLKDNRLLPQGLTTAGTTAETAVRGAAAGDADFGDGRDRVRYFVNTAGASGELTLTATLWFQPIGFRWADNLRAYDAPETSRFVRYYQSMSSESALAGAPATTTRR